jgi:hypothetical protein
MSMRPIHPTLLHLICAIALAIAVTGSAPAHAETGDATAPQYANLPSEPDETGALSSGPTPLVQTSTGFTTAVGNGSLLLRSTTPTGCLPSTLKEVVAAVAVKFGAVSLESTHRSEGHNRRAGGAQHSFHIACRAVDFRVHSRTRDVMAYLRARADVGGLKVYRTGIIHIDNGERRSW